MSQVLALFISFFAEWIGSCRLNPAIILTSHFFLFLRVLALPAAISRGVVFQKAGYVLLAICAKWSERPRVLARYRAGEGDRLVRCGRKHSDHQARPDRRGCYWVQCHREQHDRVHAIRSKGKRRRSMRSQGE